MAERIMLNINHIAKTFNPGTITEKRALTDVDLKLNEGDFVTIIGGNGAGKSTTLNAVAGVFAVDQGTIEIAGVDVTRLPEYKRAKYLGRVFQDPMTGTAATMNIEENMALAMRRGEKRTLRWGISNMERDMYREQLRTLGLGLEERMSSKVGLLSGGQRQALTLLMAALRTPKLLLLDEHTAALDPKTAAKVLELTEKIVAEQKAQRKANPLYVGIETRQPPAVAAHAIHGPDPCGLFRHVVQIVENPLFVGNGHIESLQFGLRPQQFGQRLDRRQLVKRIIAPRNPLPAELSREITGREGVAERPADQPVPFHASPFLAAIRLPTYSIPQMSRNPQAQSATAHPTCASVPVNSVKVAGSTLRSTSGCAAP